MDHPPFPLDKIFFLNSNKDQKKNVAKIMNNIFTLLTKHGILFRGLKIDTLNKFLPDLHVKCLCTEYVFFRREVVIVPGWPEN